jgi:hypothetical protein
MFDTIAVLSGNLSDDRILAHCGIGSLLAHAPQFRTALTKVRKDCPTV